MNRILETSDGLMSSKMANVGCVYANLKPKRVPIQVKISYRNVETIREAEENGQRNSETPSDQTHRLPFPAIPGRQSRSSSVPSAVGPQIQVLILHQITRGHF